MSVNQGSSRIRIVQRVMVQPWGRSQPPLTGPIWITVNCVAMRVLDCPKLLMPSEYTPSVVNAGICRNLFSFAQQIFRAMATSASTHRIR